MDLNELFNWVFANKQWIFSGIGIAIFSAIVYLVFGKPRLKMVSKSGDNSTIYQSAGNMKIRK